MASFRTLRKLAGVLIVLAALIAGFLAFRRPTASHLRAMSFLLKFSDPSANGLGVKFAAHPFKEENVTAETSWGLLRYRLYIPQDVSHPGGIVIAPGVHHLGIEHPSLISFARGLAAAGIEVMTPELRDLADYRITPRSAEMIGTSAVILSDRLREEKVGVLGLSFAGGLALMAAAKPEYASRIGLVLAIGAHDDMSRVARFFATNVIEKPDGSTAPFEAHEYGVLVMAYAHLEDFFSPKDLPIAREALRVQLWEESGAPEKARQMSAEGQAEWNLLVYHRDQIRQKLLDEVKLHADEMRAVSPDTVIANLKVPVFLLHGAGDTVIPASESLWLAHDLPAGELKGLLISPALIHVKMEDTVTFGQKWELVDFLAQVLDRTDELAGEHTLAAFKR